MNTNCLLIGDVRPGEYEAILESGVRLILIHDQNRGAPIPSSGDFYKVYFFDFSLPHESLIALLERIRQADPIHAVLNLREHYVRAQAFVARYLGLPGLSPNAAETVLSKALMRRRFEERMGAQSTPKSAKIHSLEDFLETTQDWSYPILVKPVNLYGSLFVNRIDHADDRKAVYEQTTRDVHQHIALKKVKVREEGLLQAEEFCQGSVHSIDCLIDDKGIVFTTPIVDVWTESTVASANANEGASPVAAYGHVLRKAQTALSLEQQEAARQLAMKACQALGLSSTAAHVEFISNGKALFLLEVAARPGGHRNRVLEMTYGIFLNREYVRMLLGEAPHLTKRFEKPFAIVTPFPGELSTFHPRSGRLSFEDLSSYRAHGWKTASGSQVGPARLGFQSSLWVELGHSQQGEKGAVERSFAEDLLKVCRFSDFFIPFNLPSFQSREHTL